jgi:hypothetical protein
MELGGKSAAENWITDTFVKLKKCRMRDYLFSAL